MNRVDQHNDYMILAKKIFFFLQQNEQNFGTNKNVSMSYIKMVAATIIVAMVNTKCIRFFKNLFITKTINVQLNKTSYEVKGQVRI